MGGDVRGGARLRGRRCRFERGAASVRGRERCGWTAAGVGGWGRSRKICAGPVDAATQCVFCEAGEDARARQASGSTAEVRVNGVHGRNGPLSFVWANQEGEFVGFLQLVQLLVTGNRRIFFSLLFIHQTLHWHDTQQGKSLSLLSLIPAWMRCKRDGTDTKISRRRVGV